MEEKKDLLGMLDLMTQPGFCVKDNCITAVNAAAKGLFLTPGMEVQSLLLTGREEYAAFSGGCLYLTVKLSEQPRGAVVTRMEQTDVFLLEPDCEQTELRSLALAALELRKTTNNIMTTADSLAAQAQTPDTAEQLSRLNRGLYQLLRLINNMSDAGRCDTQQETRNIGKLLAEVFEKAAGLAETAGFRLRYEGLSETVYCLVDADQLERAVLNILSNSLKFSPAGSTIDVSVTRQGRMLRLSIQDNGMGIAAGILGSVFTRYLRQPAIEDNRFGLGLGMVLVRSAATAHGGTVLIDQPQGTGTRVTMTLAIRQNTENLFRSPVLRYDYAGERDHGLLELSNCLPAHLYQEL